MTGSAEPVPHLDDIFDTVAAHLAEHHSDFVVEGGLDREFVRQATSILTETVETLTSEPREPVAEVWRDYREAPDLARTGRLRAQQNAHPAESMMAAEVLFDAALNPIVEWAALPPRNVSAVEVARVLHHAIWRRFPSGAVAYAETMRMRLSSANQESRLRVSRDLHDRVAHGIAAGLQRIELSMLDTGRPDAELVAATDVLRRTLNDVQNIAVDLRQLLGDRDLCQAIGDYAADTSTIRPPVHVSTAGSPAPIARSSAEEAFMVVLEAIRNAREHARGATAIRVTIAWEPASVTIRVSDDGPGFRHDDVATGSIGLLDMRERADSIGAHLEIGTTPDRGTAVTLSFPLARSGPR